MARYAEVAVQLPVRGLYHYGVPPRLEARQLIGSRVMVPFGNRGITGVVVRMTDDAPDQVSRLKDLDDLLDEEPQVSDELLELCLWIAEYYEAPPGEVIRAALPAGTRVKAAQRVTLTETGRDVLRGTGVAVSRAQRDLLATLDERGGSAPQRSLLKGRARVADVDALAEAGLVQLVRPADRQRIKAKTVRVARLARPLTDEDRAALGRAPKRSAVVEALQAANGSADVAALARAIPRASTHVRNLARAGIVEITTREVRGIADVGGTDLNAPAQPPVLNPAQRAALDAIESALDARAFKSFLLHGVTGSGKTEVYLHAIANVLDAGRGAIVLVPEISLTPQLAARFRARFGDQVAVLHSGLTDRERFDEWQRLRLGEARIALGARSAIFAPVRELGIVVVDEEHDSSFKQEEGVRYNARDVALVRAQKAGAACVLGSATPSLESYHGSQTGRHERLSLPGRATPRPLPGVEVIDLRTYAAEGESMLTAPLADAVAETLARNEQVILFLNRRGFSTFVMCKSCGHAFRCHQCSVSLTYHQSRDRLMCHYCGHAERVPVDCAACGSKGSIVRRGLGTEKVASGVAMMFPEARVARLDRDVATGAKVERILSRVARREVDILVGTQMVTKGHDFPAVTLVGVLMADTGLSLPDFRASERTFQLLTQVAGRAGRGDRAGRVLIQSFRPDADAIAAAAAQDYPKFYEAESAARQELGYPPFGHLVAVRIDSANAAAVGSVSRELARRASALSARMAEGEISVLGPCEAPLARLKGRTRWHLWLRASERRPLRRFLRALIDPEAVPANVRVTVDVDPISAL